MLQYNITFPDADNPISLSLSVDALDEIAQVEYKDSIPELEELINKGFYGVYGHYSSDGIMPGYDFVYALPRHPAFKDCKFELVEGQDIADKYELSIPEGAVT